MKNFLLNLWYDYKEWRYQRLCMKPKESGFDGAEGINLNNPTYIVGGFMKLRRSKTVTPESDKYNFKNQLVWYYPDD